MDQIQVKQSPAGNRIEADNPLDGESVHAVNAKNIFIMRGLRLRKFGLRILPVFRLFFVIVAVGFTAVPRFASGQTASELQTGSTGIRPGNAKAADGQQDALRMPAVNFKSTSSEVNEEDDVRYIPVTIEIDIDPAPVDAFELEYRIDERSTAEGREGRRDYTVSSRTVSPLLVSPQDDSIEIRLNISNDWYAEEGETVILILEPDDPDDLKYTLGSDSVHTVTIKSGDPTIISDADFHRFGGEIIVIESDVIWDITVYLSNGMYLGDDGNLYPAPDIPGIINNSVAPEKGLTLNYEVIGGTAKEGEDYILAEKTIQISGNESVGRLDVQILDDNEAEDTEYITLELKEGDGYNVGNQFPIIRLDILDDDSMLLPEVTFSWDSSTASENAGTHKIKVRVDPAPSAEITLSYDLVEGGTATEGEDYTIDAATVIVPANQTSADIEVKIEDDQIIEEPETVILMLTSDRTEYILGATDTHTLTITDNEPVVRFVSPESRESEDSGGDFGSYDGVAISVSPMPAETLTLSYSFNDAAETATYDVDYTIEDAGTISVIAGQTEDVIFGASAFIPVVITDDMEDEPDETVILTLTTDGTKYTLGEIVTHTLTITDNDGAPVPVVRFDLASSGANEDVGTHNVTVNINPAPPADLTLSYSLGGAATEGTDYSIENSGTILVAAGETSAGIPVMIIDDREVEARETIEFTLTAGTGYAIGNTNRHTLTIEDNDQSVPATVVLTARPEQVEEGASVEIAVTISVEQPRAVVIPLAYTPLDPYPATADDYHSLASIRIPAGALTGSGDLRTIDDDFYEEDETFMVAIDADQLSAGIESGSPVSERITITNNDSAPPVQARFSVVPRIVEEGNSVTVAVELPVELSSNVTIPLILTSISAEPEDYRAPIPRQVEIKAGETRGEYTIIINDDDEAREGDETFTVEVNQDGLPDEVGFANFPPITVTIIDNDRAGIQASAPISVLEGQTRSFPFSLTSEPQGEVTVTITGYTGTDLTVTPSVKIFLPGNWREAQEVILSAAEDPDLNNDRVPLTLTASGGGYSGISEIVEVIIIDKDAPGMNAPASVVVPEGLSEKFDVGLVRAPSGTVTVIVPSPAGDLTAVPASLIFTPDTWQTPQSVTLTAGEDDDFLPDFETLTLRANGGGYAGIAYDVAVTISENDAPGIVAPEELTMEEGSTSPFMVRLVAQPSEPVTINFTGHAGSDLTLSGVPLTFTAANWQTPQTVTLIAAEDDMDYMDDRVDLMLTASGGGYHDVIHTAIVTIKDNDEASLTISILNQQGIESEESLQLRIELNRSTEEPVTVEYTSSDAGEAEAGLDYTASRGIVIFDPGAIRGVIEIKITDDELVEENETFNVTLSNASENAEIDRAVGIGTILDNDGSAKLRVDDALVMEEEGVVQFRVSLSHPRRRTVTASYRTQDGTAKSGEDYEAVSGVVDIAPGMMEATIAVPLLKDGMDWQDETFSVHLLSAKHAEIEKAVGVATIQESAMVSEKIMEAYAVRFVRTASGQVVDALGHRFRLAVDGVACAAADRAEMAQFWYSASLWDPSLGELLADCRMSQSMPLSSGSFSVWGQGAFRQFNGQGEDVLTLQGEVTTGMFGADYRWQGGWLAGVLLSHSQGNGSFEVADQSGDITSGLTGIYPYVSYAGTGWNVWGSAGGGLGQVEVLELKGDMASRFGALGMRGKLASGSAIVLNYHGDILMTDVEIADHDITAEVYRVRAGVEVNARITGAMHPYLEVNVRQDGGSAETGTGLELGGGLRFFYPAWGLRGDMHTQGLVMHTADGFTEWGISGLLQLGNSSEGMMMRVRPSRGRGQGMSLHRQQTILDVMPLQAAANRTELELGYGIPWMDGVARSVVGVIRLPQGRMYRIGGELRPRDRWTFSVFGLTHGHSNARRDIGVNLQGAFQY